MPGKHVAVAAALLLTAQTPHPAETAGCANAARDTRAFLAADAIAVKAPNGALSLVTVRDEPARRRGLMCVLRVPRGKGMIFVFAPPDEVRGFWMKETLVPLDMIFVAADGRVTGVAANVPATPEGTPDERIARRSGLGRYVIELAAGDAARYGIKAGVTLRLPQLAAE